MENFNNNLDKYNSFKSMEKSLFIFYISELKWNKKGICVPSEKFATKLR